MRSSRGTSHDPHPARPALDRRHRIVVSLARYTLPAAFRDGEWTAMPFIQFYGLVPFTWTARDVRDYAYAMALPPAYLGENLPRP